MVLEVHSKINTIFVALIIYCITTEVAYCISGTNSDLKDTATEFVSTLTAVATTAVSGLSSRLSNLSTAGMSLWHRYTNPNTDKSCYYNILSDLKFDDPVACAKYMFEKKTIGELQPSTQNYVRYLYGRIIIDQYPCHILEKLFFYKKIERAGFNFGTIYQQNIVCKTNRFEPLLERGKQQKNVDVYEFIAKDISSTYFAKYALFKNEIENSCDSLSRFFYGTKNIDITGDDLAYTFVDAQGIFMPFIYNLESKKAVAPVVYCDGLCFNQVSVAFNYCKIAVDCFQYAYLYIIRDHISEHAKDYLDHLIEHIFIKKSTAITPTIFCDTLIMDTITDKYSVKYASELKEETLELEILTCKIQMIKAKLGQKTTKIPEVGKGVNLAYAKYVMNNISLTYLSHELKYAEIFVVYLMKNVVAYKAKPDAQTPELFCDPLKKNVGPQTENPNTESVDNSVTDDTGSDGTDSDPDELR